MQKKQRFYIWLLPAVWAVCSFIHRSFPGDEYGLYAFASIVGAWIIFVIRISDIHNPMLPASIALTGAVVMAGVGWFMDWMRIWKKLWVIIYAICVIGIFILSILSFPSIERALSKNGSWMAYILFSINFGMYLSVIFSISLTGTARLWKKLRAKKQHR